MTQYRATWTITIDADSPETAAAELWTRIFNGGPMEADTFELTDAGEVRVITVDTAQDVANAYNRQGINAWYHNRQKEYLARNWPILHLAVSRLAEELK